MFARGRFSQEVKIVPILSGLQTVANADRTSEVIDTDGFDGVCVVVHFLTVHDSATQSIRLSSSDAVTDQNTLNDGSNVADSAQTVAGTADNTVKYIDFVPEKRYYQLVVDKDASNAGDECAIAYLYKAASKPVTQASGNTVVGEGTAAVAGEYLGLAIQGTA